MSKIYHVPPDISIFTSQGPEFTNGFGVTCGLTNAKHKNPGLLLFSSREASSFIYFQKIEIRILCQVIQG